MYKNTYTLELERMLMTW